MHHGEAAEEWGVHRSPSGTDARKHRVVSVSMGLGHTFRDGSFPKITSGL